MDEHTVRLVTLQAEICKTLSDPTRLMIIHELRNGETSVGQLASSLGLAQSNVSHHLAVLRDRSVVVTRREGATVYYRLANPKIAMACDLVREVLEGQLADTSILATALETAKSYGITPKGGS
jgi:DNA-binding transcriptional ArsR family regulator